MSVGDRISKTAIIGFIVFAVLAFGFGAWAGFTQF